MFVISSDITNIRAYDVLICRESSLSLCMKLNFYMTDIAVVLFKCLFVFL